MLVPNRAIDRFLIRPTRRLHLLHDRQAINSTSLTDNRRTHQRVRRHLRNQRSNYTITIKGRRSVHTIHTRRVSPPLSLHSLVITMPRPFNLQHPLLDRSRLRRLIMQHNMTNLRPLLPNQKRSHTSKSRNRHRTSPLHATRVPSRNAHHHKISIIRRLATSRDPTIITHLLSRFLPILLKRLPHTITLPTMLTPNTNRSHTVLRDSFAQVRRPILSRLHTDINRNHLRYNNTNLIRSSIRRRLTNKSQYSHKQRKARICKQVY